MKELYKILGKVSVTPAGAWSKEKEYERLDIVTDNVTNYSYISKTCVPQGIEITNTDYWQRIGSSGFKDNNIIVLFDVDPSTGELVKYNLKSAIAQIDEVDRHPGLILGFYGTQGENKDTWFLYQYISNNVDNFEDTNYWISLYNNVNKFKGYFTSEEILFEIINEPTVGDYAYVGETMEDSYLYICNENGVWTNTNTKAYLFANLFKAVHSKDFSELEYTIDEQYCDRAEKDALGNIIHFTYATKDGLQNNIFESIYKALEQVTLPEGSINLEQLSDSLKDYIASGGNVSNYPDEEDLTVAKKGVTRVLKFKDKKYKPLDFSGKGRKFLRKNMTDGINVLEQALFDFPNTIYIIQYDYCLNGATIEIPENCVLKFEGGSFNGGTIVLNNTRIEGIAYEIDVPEEELSKSRIVSHIVNDTTFINMTFEGTYAVGQQLFHKSLKIPIWWNGDTWITQEWMSTDVIGGLIDSKLDSEQFEVFKNQYNRWSDGVATTLDDLDVEITQHRVDIKTIKKDISDINDAVDLLDSEITHNTKDIIAHGKDIDTIKKDISDINNAIDTLDGDITANRGEIINIKKNVTDIENNKVDKVEGKELSTNDFTDEYKSKLDSMLSEETIDNKIATKVDRVHFDDIVSGKADVTQVDASLAAVNNNISSVSTTVQSLQSNKVDKVVGKQLSTEDFTTALKTKLEGLTNYNDTELSTKIEELKNALDVILDSENTTAVIDTWQEIENFLAGITNTETLTGLLTDLKDEIVALCASTYLSKNNGIIIHEDTFYVGARLPSSFDATKFSGNGFLECYTKGVWWNFKAGKYIVSGGTSSQFLKADGSVDSTDYLPTASYTASDVLDKVKSVDGAGSGLDADTVDGRQLSGLCLYENNLKLNEVNTGAFIGSNSSTYINDYGGQYPIAEVGGYICFGNINGRGMQIYGSYNNNRWFARGAGLSNATYTPWKEFAFLDSNVASADKLTTKRLTDEDLNELKDGYLSYWAGDTNTCLNKPDGVTYFGLQIIKTSQTLAVQVLTTEQGVIYKRRWNGSGWSAWQQFATTDGAVTKLTAKQLTNEDLNDIKTHFACYYAVDTNTCANKPDNVTWFGLQVTRWGGHSDVVQTLYFNDKVYIRRYNGVSWTSWKQLVTTDGAVAKLTTKQLTNENLDTIKDVNFSSYYATSSNTCANKPNEVTSFHLTCQACGNGAFLQRLYGYNKLTDYRRYFDPGLNAWEAWKKMLTEDNIAPLISRIEALEARPNILKVNELPSNPDSNTLYCIPE